MAYQDFGAFRTIHTDDYATYVTDEEPHRELGSEAAYERFLNYEECGWPPGSKKLCESCEQCRDALPMSEPELYTYFLTCTCDEA